MNRKISAHYVKIHAISLFKGFYVLQYFTSTLCLLLLFFPSISLTKSLRVTAKTILIHKVQLFASDPRKIISLIS